jgi:L-threonylcarbamoyladenylate synthase
MLQKTEVLFLDEKNRASIAEKVGSYLNRGEICVIPTDTIYGIVAADYYSDSVIKIYEIKSRPKDKPFIRLIGNLDTLALYTEQLLPENLGAYWPGPLTIIFRGINDETVSIRFPDDPFLKDLFRVMDYKALVAPSANISGDENIFDSDILIETFIGKVSVIVCLKDGLHKKKASTIVDISSGSLKLVRVGDLKLELI